MKREIIDGIEGKDFVTCKICHQKFLQIINAHTWNKHRITLDEYKEKFQDANILSDKRYYQISVMLGKKRPDHSKKMKGSNNPMFGKKRSENEIKILSETRKGKGIGVAGKYERTEEIRNKISNSLNTYYENNPGLRQNPEYVYYRSLVQKETLKWKQELIDNWDGKCYYTGVDLITAGSPYQNNFWNVDHKISCKYGFDNNILPEIIGHIDNLCICGRYINLIKSVKNEKEFINECRILQSSH